MIFLKAEFNLLKQTEKPKKVSLLAKYSSAHTKQSKSLNPKHRGNICDYIQCGMGMTGQRCALMMAEASLLGWLARLIWFWHGMVVPFALPSPHFTSLKKRKTKTGVRRSVWGLSHRVIREQSPIKPSINNPEHCSGVTFTLSEIVFMCVRETLCRFGDACKGQISHKHREAMLETKFKVVLNI